MGVLKRAMPGSLGAECTGKPTRRGRDGSPESLRPHGTSPVCRDGVQNQVPLNSKFTLFLLPGCHPQGKGSGEMSHGDWVWTASSLSSPDAPSALPANSGS